MPTASGITRESVSNFLNPILKQTHGQVGFDVSKLISEVKDNFGVDLLMEEIMPHNPNFTVDIIMGRLR